MNAVAANLLLHTTASVRFEGPLNVDLNDITMNLVPYPRMHFLLSAMSPLQPHGALKERDVGKAAAAAALQPRTLDQVGVPGCGEGEYTAYDKAKLDRDGRGRWTRWVCLVPDSGQGCWLAEQLGRQVAST